GAHDGTDPLELDLERIIDGGATIIAAAGNDGDRAIHAAGRAIAGAPADVTVHLPEPRGMPAERWVALSIRMRGGERIAIGARDGTWIAQERGSEREIVEHSSGAMIIDRWNATLPNDVASVRAVIAGGGDHPPLRGGDYTLRIFGEGATFDAWI